MNMFCKNCGNPIKPGSKFCGICGYKFTNKHTLGHYIKKAVKWSVIFTLIIFVLALIGNSSENTNSSTSISKAISPTPKPTNQTDNASNVVADILCNNQNGGSGMVLTNDGIVLTNNHVIAGATSCVVTLPDYVSGATKEIYIGNPVSFPGLSQKYDIATVNITSAYTDKNGKTWGMYPLNFTTYKNPTVCNNYIPTLGDQIRIYGYPVTSGGYNLTITDGIISSFSDDGYILTSAKVDSGNSGGFAISQNGCWLGIPSAVVSGNYQNLGVIIPVNIIMEFANQIPVPKSSP